MSNKTTIGLPKKPIHHKPSVEITYAPGIVIAYPDFDDWRGLYDFQGTLKSRGLNWNQDIFHSLANNHVKSVTEELDLISKRTTGRVVFGAIKGKSPLKVRIFPYDFMSSSNWSSRPLAVTSAADWNAAWQKNAPVIGAGPDGKRFSSDDIGSGDGSDADIFFSKKHSSAIKLPDEVLIHELVHASRIVGGEFYDMPMSGGYGNQEEFLAVVIADMYRSEKRRPLINYHGGSIDAATFLDIKLSPTPRLVLALLRSRQSSLFTALAQAKTPFNPFQQVDAELKALIAKIERD